MATRELWEGRARRLGHTGYKDPIMYAYDQPLRRRALQDALDQLTHKSLPTSWRALDLGCGIGDFSGLLRARDATVFGIDLSRGALQRARNRFSADHDVFFVQASAEAIPLGSGSVDLVTTITVLQHVLPGEGLKAALSEIRRVLVRHGRLIALEIAPVSVDHGREEGLLVEPGLMERRLSTWLRIFAEAGFTLEWFRPYGPWGIELVRGLRLLLSKVVPYDTHNSGSEGAEGEMNPGDGSSHGPASRRVIRGMYDLVKRGILGLAYPIDYWLGLRVPGRWAYYHLFVLSNP